MSLSRGTQKQRWVVHCDPLTVQAVKALASSSGFSIGHVLDTAVEYFSRKVEFDEDKPLKWSLPSDF